MSIFNSRLPSFRSQNAMSYTTKGQLIVAAATVLCASEVSRAEQFVVQQRGREVVVHSNAIPVILHRLVPPNYGRHVTIREYRTGQIPPPKNAIQNSRPAIDLKRK